MMELDTTIMPMLYLNLLCLISIPAIHCEDDPLSTPEGYLTYNIKMSASLSPDYETVGYWNGSVYGWTYSSGGEPQYEKLFLFEGFNVRRVYLEEDGHYVSLSREVSMYKGPCINDK